MTKTLVGLVLAAALTVFFFYSASMAKTPDGQTPSEETICDVETGAAFGLCNAYCEAMDCDSPDTRANQRACDRVAQNFMDKTDRMVTCEAALCRVDCQETLDTAMGVCASDQETCIDGCANTSPEECLEGCNAAAEICAGTAIEAHGNCVLACGPIGPPPVLGGDG